MAKLNKVLITFFLMIAAFQAQAQESIEGIWLTEDGNSKVEIYQKNGNYFGKIVWLKQPVDKNGDRVKDLNNPNRELKNRPILGIDLLKDLKSKSGKWYGQIYAPKRGLELDAVIIGLGKEKLEITISYRGFTRKQIWTKSTR
jgi:uncharacterized protein (DUF2147 family)